MKSFAILIFVALAIASASALPSSLSLTREARETFELLPPTCYNSFAQAAECRSNLPASLTKSFNAFAADRVIESLRTRYFERSASKRASLGVAEDLADSLLYQRSGLAEGCFFGFVHETGAITAVPYAQWYDDGAHAPLAYKTYLTTSPVNAPVTNCANQSVYDCASGVECVCDNSHPAMTYCYIGYGACSQPAECPHD